MEFNRKKFPSYFMIATIFFVIIWFNALYFKNRISSNHQTISEYSLSDKDITPEAKLAVAAFFYPAESYQSDKDSDGYIEHKSLYNKDTPRLLIEPHHGYRRSGAVAAASYNHLRRVSSKIKNIFLLGPLHKNIKGAVLPKANSIKTPLGDITVNHNIINELQQNSVFDKNQNYPLKNSVNVQLPYIAKTFKSVKIVPILYGDVEAKDLFMALKKYVSHNNLIVIMADLPGKFISSPNEKEQDILSATNHDDCGKVGIETAMLLAKEYSLVPQLISVDSIADYKGFSFNQRGWSYDEPEERTVLHGIELFNHNLRNFVRHHKKALLEITHNSLSLGASEHYKVKRKHYNNFLFNRGASFVSIYYKGELLGSLGEVIATKAVAADIADNIFRIMNSLGNKKIADINSLDISLQLLTDLEEIKFSSQEDLLAKVEYGIDGLLIRSGKREGFLLPDTWLDVDSKEDFLTKLKIKAGLSPTYWSDNIKVFRFRVVEVIDDKDL